MIVAARCSAASQQQQIAKIHKPQQRHRLGTSQTHTLPSALSLEDARAALQAFIRELGPPCFSSGILRLQVPLPRSIKALHWIQCQPEDCPLLLPRIYFSPRNAPDCLNRKSRSFTVAGVGSTVTFRGERESFSADHWKSINRFLSEDSPLVRAYGAMRFNPDIPPSPHWQAFGTFYFFIPQVEVCESGNYSLLAVNLGWGDDITYQAAAETLLTTLNSVVVQITSSLNKLRLINLTKQHTPDRSFWHANVSHVLEELSNHSTGLTKAVLARQTKLEIEGQVPPFTLLASLQEQNPFAYQFCLQLPDGSAFIGNTPEQLFAREELLVTSEAVAATRPRGATSVDDYLIALDLLQSSKDHTEFQIVQDGVQKAMESVCRNVRMVMTKGIVKQPKVQHLCTRFVGEVADKHEEYDLLAALHPTAAVCGHPRDTAKAVIDCTETFDRGLYAGPVGWFGGRGSEFAVGIRSALIKSCDKVDFQRNNGSPSSTGVKDMLLFAGVGIVEGSDSNSEWQELELKISQFEALLQPSKQLRDAANINMLWANLIVEECCRLGVTCFCVAPGSRSSPLAEAAAANPRVTCVSCLDERALGFFAVGYGRGARKPAAVVTTSGTALSNLLPAIVEASQDCIPLLVLSADRPHELRDTGSNQTINQIEHFGKYVRYHFDFPPASDEVPARMVLTTVDTAVFHASTDPFGPVHVNCPLREPLEAVPRRWESSCLEGLTQWMTSSSPFTTYIPASEECSTTAFLHTISSQMRAVTDIIAGAKRGVIVVGGLNQSHTSWSVYKLAEHLNWPLVPDVLSGLRLTSNKTVNIIHNLDHVLLCSSLHKSVAPDVILQIGSRITSKRLSCFLQECCPRAYILVEEHPYRHDPGHRLTHRIKCSIAEFSRIVLKELGSSSSYSSPDKAYGFWLQLLSQTVRRKILSQIQAQVSLTEPGIAQIVSSSISSDSAIFLGNSMPIRDVDMYADVFSAAQDSSSLELDDEHQNLPLITCVAANRGASGIDGVMSTAIGFAAGSKKRVTLLLGDVSFLHDTNGLMLLTARDAQPPVTVVVVNNRGGGIFSLLPVANLMQEVPFRSLISTEHEVQLAKLCHAYRLSHTYVGTKEELERALKVSYSSSSNSVIEVGSNIQENAEFHRHLQSEIRCHLDRVFPLLWSRISHERKFIRSLELSAYRFPLKHRPTTESAGTVAKPLYREGFLVRVSLGNGSSGLGEVAPLHGLHEEDLIDAQEQLCLLKHKLKDAEVPESLALLDGSFSKWLSDHLGAAQADIIFPSVRCGLEMAVLEALAASNNLTLFELLSGRSFAEGGGCGDEICVEICGLIDSLKTPHELASIAAQLVQDGFKTLKMKVARRRSPLEDAAAVIAVREKVGSSIKLRVDANRLWKLPMALEFANAVRDCDLEFIEEPVDDPSALVQFLQQTPVPVALDETIDDHINLCSYSQLLKDLPREKLVAAVIKPNRVGGLENANILAGISHKWKLTTVVSSCFESSLALAVFAQFAAFLEKNITSSSSSNDGRSHATSFAHGLGTYSWIGQDLVETSFSQSLGQQNKSINVTRAAKISSTLLRSVSSFDSTNITNQFTTTVDAGNFRFKFGILEISSNSSITQQKKPTLVFLHGFLGSVEDWIPVMDPLAASFRCLAINLPGHGQNPSSVASKIGDDDHEQWGMQLLVEAVMEALKKLVNNGSKVILAGYSMGARVSLCIASRNSDLIQGVVSVSGSPGIRDELSRHKRVMEDDDLADSIRSSGLEAFVNLWYRKPLWRSLRRHPEFHFVRSLRSNVHRQEALDLADTLSRLSVGRQENLWEELEKMSVALMVVVGDLDDKFVRIGGEMKRVSSDRGVKLVQIKGCGHSVHVECPLVLIQLVRKFAAENND